MLDLSWLGITTEWQQVGRMGGGGFPRFECGNTIHLRNDYPRYLAKIQKFTTQNVEGGMNWICKGNFSDRKGNGNCNEAEGKNIGNRKL